MATDKQTEDNWPALAEKVHRFRLKGPTDNENQDAAFPGI